MLRWKITRYRSFSPSLTNICRVSAVSGTVSWDSGKARKEGQRSENLRAEGSQEEFRLVSLFFPIVVIIIFLF